MRKIICDVCGEEVERVVNITVLDGEHPHNGSAMYKTIDCCLDCIFKFNDLRSNVEFSNLRELKKSD